MSRPEDAIQLPHAPRLRFGAFEIDLQERELRNRGIRLQIQHKPFQVLELLLERRGALVTRAELAQRLWPNLHVSYDHGLNTAVNTLRQILGDSIRTPRYIETRPGLGYRFIAPVEEIPEGGTIGRLPRDRQRGGNMEAYQDYLRGRFFLNRMNEADARKSLACFESAIEQDGQCALAYAGLADAYCLLAVLGGLQQSDAYRRAGDFALAALRMDTDLPEAHAALGTVRQIFERDSAGAEASYLKALRLDPVFAAGHRRYAELLCAMGRFAEASEEIQRAVELDPLSLPTNIELAWTRYVARDFENAVQHSWRTLVLEPAFAPAQTILGLAYEQMGMYDEAIIEFENARTCSEGHPATIAALAHATARAGKQSEAERHISELDAMSQRRYVSHYWKAIAHLGLGAVETALNYLGEACDRHEVWLMWLDVEPRLDPVRGNAHFERIAASAGLRNRAYATGL